jgi:hypothetical protein
MGFSNDCFEKYQSMYRETCRHQEESFELPQWFTEDELLDLTEEVKAEISNNILFHLPTSEKTLLYLAFLRDELNILFASSQNRVQAISLAGLIRYTERIIDAMGIDRYSEKYSYLLDNRDDISINSSQGNYGSNETIEKHLECFSGSIKGKGAIMSNEEYQRLLMLTMDLVSSDECPEIEKPFQKLPLSNEFIRYTYSRLHDELYPGKTINDNWVEFLHKAFKQFTGDTNTTKIKFRTYQKNYKQDRGEIHFT